MYGVPNLNDYVAKTRKTTYTDICDVQSYIIIYKFDIIVKYLNTFFNILKIRLHKGAYIPSIYTFIFLSIFIYKNIIYKYIYIDKVIRLRSIIL